MRLLIGVIIVLVTLFALQGAHPECSMTGVTGVEWVNCLASWG